MKKTIIITGGAGLVGSHCAKKFHQEGYHIVILENNMRSYFFGKKASTEPTLTSLKNSLKNLDIFPCDIREKTKIEEIFKNYSSSTQAIIHTAAQPSHDWAAKEPHTDFAVNATATLNLLEATRKSCPEAPFIFTSTNKVYGDNPNSLPLEEKETRFEIEESHPYYPQGVPENFSIDHTKHSLFGVSKTAADLLVQEYGRYFQMPTVCFRGGCLTGPSHQGAQLHGFLSYLISCTLTKTPYKILGYKGKQVRDNIHADDLAQAFHLFSQNPKSAAVYNIGGGRRSNCSILEAIQLAEDLTGNTLPVSYHDQNRIGDHIWWISNTQKFQKDFPNWKPQYSLEKIFSSIIEDTKTKLP